MKATKTKNEPNTIMAMGHAGDELNGIDPPMGRILKRKELLKIVGLSSAQLYRNIKKGLFPPPYAIGEKAVGWKQSEIAAWIDGLRPATIIRKG